MDAPMRSRLEPVVLTLALSLGACSDDTIGPTAGKFDELCGEQAPIRLLPIDPDRIPIFVQGRVFAERYVFMLRFGDLTADDVYEIWSTGLCGEAPTRLIDGQVSWISDGYEPWPDIAFVCDASSGQILALDPSGALPPNAVFQTRECFHQVTATGVVTISSDGDATTGPLVLQPWPEDPLTQAAEQIVLVDEVRRTVDPPDHTGEPEVLRSNPNEVFAITPADELVVVSLDDLAVNVLAEGARDVEPSPSGRYVLWHTPELTNVESLNAVAALFLIDRESGVTTKLDERALISSSASLRLEALGLLSYEVEPVFGQLATRWVRLDTLESDAVLGAELTTFWRIDDSRAVLAGPLYSRAPFYLLDVSIGELTLLYDGHWTPKRPHEHGFYMQEGDRLIDVSYTGETRTLARHWTGAGLRMLSDERVLTPFAVGKDSIGDLVIVDPNTLAETYVDLGVNANSINTHESPIDGESLIGGDLVSYLVVDADPERHGIWLAKPAK
jgi:hypothetical protein